MLYLWLLLSTLALDGRATTVFDGDTFVLLTSNNQSITIRVAQIDAPEYGQAYSDQSRHTLEQLLLNRSVRVEVTDIDRYGRTVGHPFVEDLDISAEMVRRGAAWAYRHYLTDSRLLDLENGARSRHQGLWQQSEPLPPWVWRQTYSGKNHRAPPVTGVNDALPGSRCQIKGNINDRGERIYHVPGMQHYARTIIQEIKDERWFCSERQALDAGWRRARK